MMMEKPRPSEEEETDAIKTKASAVVAPAPPPPPPVEEKKLPSNPEEAVEDLERRLGLLGGATDGGVTAGDEAPAPAAEDEKKDDKSAAPPAAAAPVMNPKAAAAPLIPDPVQAPVPAPAPAPVQTPAPAPVAAKTAAPAAPAGGKSALLARIMAAQERAKAAEEQQKRFEEELNRPKQKARNAAEEQEKMLKALSGEATETETAAADNPPPPPFEVAEKTMAPPPFEVAEKTMAPPPFEVAEKTMAPPPFEAVEEKKNVAFDGSAKVPAVPAPSAPTFDPLEVAPPPPAAAGASSDADMSLLQEGIERIVPPPASSAAGDAPPSFEQFEATTTTEDASAFEYDLDGNPLSPEERKKMMEEQRAIMEEIQREAALNAKAIAAAQAENFDQRSGSAAVRAVGGAPRRPAASAAASSAASASAAAAGGQEGTTDANGQTVGIGGGQNVALHGQEKTKKAIADGTAILVECINCQNWMQVTESATLMFCPVCSVVSPVMKQDDVMTKEEAVQLTMDRKLAEQLQAEINAEAAEDGPRSRRAAPSQEEEGYMAAALRRLRGEEAPEPGNERLISGSSGQQARPRPHHTQEKSWWDTFSEYVGVGVTEGANERRAGEISVSLPPGAKAGSASTATAEQRGLLASVDGHGAASGPVVRDSAPTLPPSAMRGGPARVAESKPLFSCVVDSMSSAASAVGTALTTSTLGDGSDINGVDSAGLLSVTQVGRGQDGGGGSGSYHQLQSNDNL